MFKRSGSDAAHIASCIGDFAIDLYVLCENGLLEGLGFNSSVFLNSELNAFMELERPCWRATRARLAELLTDGHANNALSGNEKLRKLALVPSAECEMQMPCTVGDYTDFYSSREHATNVGIMFRGKDNALQPNWLHLPVGYHGRSSSVVVSGTDVVRPSGQLAKNRENFKEGSNYGPCRLLDFELEMAIFLGGKENAMGETVDMSNAEDRIFGVVVMNDWSARDIQAWEYVPLGPFTAKNFATTVSPWIVSLDALEPYRCAPSSGDAQVDPVPLPYITDPDYSKGQYDVTLEIGIQGANDKSKSIVSTSNLKHMYWNFKQQLVHHSVSGCPMRAGDLLGTGTISGPAEDKLGSMLELSWRGSREIKLNNAESEEDSIRKFLKDGDVVSMVGYTADGLGPRIGFGDCLGKILPVGTKRSAADISGPSDPTFSLHSYWRSTCSWRVRVALAHHGFTYDYKPVDLAKLVGNTTPMSEFDGAYAAENSMEQVPLLTNNADGVKLTQSMAIIEYLEDLASSRSGGCQRLIPTDPVTKARAREIAELVNSGIQPLQNLSVLRQVKTATLVNGGDVDGKGFATACMHKGLAKLEALIIAAQSNGAGPYAAGTAAPTIADLCIVPQCYNAGRFGCDLNKEYPTLAAVNELCAKHPAFIAAAPEAQPDAPKP